MQPARITLLALPCAAVLGVLTASITTWPVASACLAAWSAAHTLVVINFISYRQVVTPDELLGWVNTASRMLSWGIGWPMGAALDGVSPGQAGVRATLVGLACVGIVAAVVAWISPLRTRADDSGMVHAWAGASSAPIVRLRR